MSEKGAGGDDGGNDESSSASRLEVVGTGAGDERSAGDAERRLLVIRRGADYEPGK